MNLLRSEPALVIAGINALVVLLISFGVPISADQKTSLDAFAAAVLAVVAGAAIRTQVSPSTPSSPSSSPPTPPTKGT